MASALLIFHTFLANLGIHHLLRIILAMGGIHLHLRILPTTESTLLILVLHLMVTGIRTLLMMESALTHLHRTLPVTESTLLHLIHLMTESIHLHRIPPVTESILIHLHRTLLVTESILIH